MIVAQQMEKAMDAEMGEMVGESLTLGFGFARRRFVGDCNIAEHFAAGGGRKREYIGGFRATAPTGVEFAHGGVIAQHDSEFARRGRACHLGGFPDGAAEHGFGIELVPPQW
jgi:hypothetical protein